MVTIVEVIGSRVQKTIAKGCDVFNLKVEVVEN